MFKKFAAAALVVFCFSALAHATVVTTGDIALLTTGLGGFPSSATPVLSTPLLDLALPSHGSTAYANGVINNGGYAVHQISHLNDGTYGNSNSWIGGVTQNVQDPTLSTTLGQGFAGIDLPNTAQYLLTAFAFGRDQTGVYNDRANGTYYVQYTTAGNANASTPDSSYTTLGSITISDNDALRHLYSIPIPVLATGLRIIVPLTANSDFFGAQAIDEIEILGVPEPSTIVLGGLGLVGLLIARRRRKVGK